MLDIFERAVQCLWFVVVRDKVVILRFLFLSRRVFKKRGYFSFSIT